MKNYTTIMTTPIGALGFRTEEDALWELDFLYDYHTTIAPRNPLDKEVARQLKAFFKDGHFTFDLPITLEGTTPYQERVLKVMQAIPPGCVKEYGVVSDELDSSPRAVGNACRANPIAVIIPCHRIVAKGSLGGFDGSKGNRTLDVKHWLLAHEGYVA